MSLDFAQTCPDIDASISDVKTRFAALFEEVIEDVSPRLPAELVEEMAKDYAENAYRFLESSFEVVRKTNEDMRAQANYQIADLEDKVADLKRELESREVAA